MPAPVPSVTQSAWDRGEGSSGAGAVKNNREAPAARAGKKPILSDAIFSEPARVPSLLQRSVIALSSFRWTKIMRRSPALAK